MEPATKQQVSPPPPPAPAGTSPRTLEEIERDQILAALERHNGNRAAAAAELGISVRTLYYKLAAFGQSVPGVHPEAR